MERQGDDLGGRLRHRAGYIIPAAGDTFLFVCAHLRVVLCIISVWLLRANCVCAYELNYRAPLIEVNRF